jgi:hypothetical protein
LGKLRAARHTLPALHAPSGVLTIAEDDPRLPCVEAEPSTGDAAGRTVAIGPHAAVSAD